MKANAPLTIRTTKPARKGAALIMVLMFVALLALIAIGILSRVTSDRSSSSAYSNATRSQTLTEYAVNAVMTQISKATTQGASVAWASQPGMLRTFDTDDNNTAYKLYSAPKLTVDYRNSGDLIELDLPPEDWSESPALWTDLNKPVSVENETRYPILDPAALGTVEGFSVADVPGSTTEQPIPMPVQWLYLLEDGTLSPGTLDDSGSEQSVVVADATAENPVVGRIAFWTDDETSKVNINTASEGAYWDTPRITSTTEKNFANYQPARREFQRYPGHPAMTSLAPVFFATDATSTPDPLSPEERDAIYRIVPRIVGGGSEAGKVIADQPLLPDAHRLYTNLDELLFSIDRSVPNTLTDSSSGELITKESIEEKRFFLTATSRAPEVTLFNTPRIATWPVHRDPNDPKNADKVTAYDRLLVFCASTPPNQPYHFQREDAKSPTNDWENIPRNRQLLRYLRALSNNQVPGFGAPLVSKTSSQDRDQLLVEMFDYIRSSNLYDDNLSKVNYLNQNEADNAIQFTAGRRNHTFLSYNGHGVVAPIRVPADFGDTYPPQPDKDSSMGFGRFHTITEAGLLFICNADGKNGSFDEPLDDAGNPLSGTPSSTQLAKLMSNVATGTSVDQRTYGYEFNNSPTNPEVVAASPNRAYPENRLVETKLNADERRIQMILFFDYFVPMHGWTQYGMDGSLDVVVQGEFTIGGQNVTFASDLETINFSNTGLWGYHPWGAYLGYRKGLQEGGGRRTPGEPGETPSKRYGLLTQPFTITVPENGLMSFRGPEKLSVKLYSRQKDTGRAQSRSEEDLVQTIELKFPDADFPIPTLVTRGSREIVNHSQSTLMHNWWSLSYESPFDSMPAPAPPVTTWPGGRRGYLGNFGRLSGINNRPYETSGNYIRTNDTLRTLVPYHADFRLIAGSHYVSEGVFQPSTFYFSPVRRDAGGVAEQVQSYFTSSGATNYDGHFAFYRPAVDQRLVATANYNTGRFPKFPGFAVSDAERKWARPYQRTGDFDNGLAHIADGAYLNKPDEGNTSRPFAGAIPYFSHSWKQTPPGPTFFTPNRQIPGPGMFGSLPTQLRSGNRPYDPNEPATTVEGPWQTLLFRPQSGHPGAANPPDHLWLDYFWMPVVEPYAISEPFSTAGKINLNYAIAPFSYIRRATGLACLMRAERMMAIPTNKANVYKNNSPDYRYKLAIHETLKQMDRKFSKGEVFRSATEICDIHLIPEGTTLNSDGSDADAIMQNYWEERAITGDNSRERPYTNLHTRLATKSNVYTIHYRVEVLKKTRGSDPSVWNEEIDSVAATYRGSTTVERYLDPNLDIPDYAALYSANPSATPADLGSFYKFRVLADQQFNP